VATGLAAGATCSAASTRLESHGAATEEAATAAADAIHCRRSMPGG
jgi:hypothetical protein